MATFVSVFIVIVVVLLLGIRRSRRLSIPSSKGRRMRQLPNRGPRRANREQRAIIWRKYGGRCAHCGKKCIKSYDSHPDRGEIDHIVPWSWGGQTTLRNMQLLCNACNQRKGARHAG